jgi:two-component system, NarL family, sensor kinase
MNDVNIQYTVIIGMISMMTIIIAVITYFQYGQRKISDVKLKQKEQELLFQKELLLNTVKTQEKERDRIATELHDDIASKLNVVHLNLHILKKYVDPSDEATSVLDRITSSLKHSAERTRSISHELMPLIIKKTGIKHAINELVNDMNLSKTLEVVMENENVLKITNDFKALHIYRMLQELFNNTIKYARAKRVNIIFNEIGENVQLKYTDDGIGFDPKELTLGLGLSNVKTRCELLQGHFLLESEKGKGFTCIITFPNNDNV